VSEVTAVGHRGGKKSLFSCSYLLQGKVFSHTQRSSPGVRLAGVLYLSRGVLNGPWGIFSGRERGENSGSSFKEAMVFASPAQKQIPEHQHLSWKFLSRKRRKNEGTFTLPIAKGRTSIHAGTSGSWEEGSLRSGKSAVPKGAGRAQGER